MAKSDIESDIGPKAQPVFKILSINNVIMHGFRRILHSSYLSAKILAISKLKNFLDVILSSTWTMFIQKIAT